MPWPGWVHHVTSSPSVSEIVEFGVAGAKIQKSGQYINLDRVWGGQRNAPAMLLINPVWHIEFWFSVVELQILYPV